MLIGLVGFKGSGKDTVAKHLVQTYGYRQDSFAKPLKDALAAIFNWDRALIEGNTAESRNWREQPDEFWSIAMGKSVTPRQILQQIGTEVFRDNFLPDIWVQSLLARSQGTNNNVVISDVRFPNEMEAIKEAGGLLFRIKRGKEPDWLDHLLICVSDNPDASIEEIEEIFNEQERFTQGELGSIHYTIKELPHRSEWEWVTRYNLLDEILVNDSTIEKLYEKVDLAVALEPYIK